MLKYLHITIILFIFALWLNYMHVKIKDKNIFFDKIKPKNQIDFIESILKVYSALNFDDKSNLPKAERTILAYYVLHGLTEETLKNVLIDFPKYAKGEYLHQMNKNLRDKGYLIREVNNFKKFHLNEDLLHIRKKFIEDKCKSYYIGFETD